MNPKFWMILTIVLAVVLGASILWCFGGLGATFVGQGTLGNKTTPHSQQGGEKYTSLPMGQGTGTRCTERYYEERVKINGQWEWAGYWKVCPNAAFY